MQLADQQLSVEAARQLGYDLYLYRGHLENGTLPPAVAEGFRHAESQRPPRAAPDRFVRKWLQLREQAMVRGRAFDEEVTPALLRRLDLDRCPVTRDLLTHGERVDTDWSIDRLNNQGGYAPNNLAVMSTRANKAKGNRSFEEVYELSARQDPVDGLSPVEWSRMAALMLGPCFAEKPVLAPLIAHPVPVTSHRLLLASQQVQHVFCTRAAASSGKNLLIKAFRFAAPSQCAELRLRLLAERVHAQLRQVEQACDVWLDPETMNSLRRWRDALDENAWAMAAEVSRQLAGGRLVAPQRLRTWHVGTRGYVSPMGTSRRSSAFGQTA